MQQSSNHLNTLPFERAARAERPFVHPGYAAAHQAILRALELRQGFVLVTGPPGVGKSLLVAEVLAAAAPQAVRSAQVSSAGLGGEELLRLAAYRFGIPAEPMSQSTVMHQLERVLRQQHRAGRRAVLVVDDAHELDTPALHLLHNLLDLNQDGAFLLQILLVAHPQLHTQLQRPAHLVCRRQVVSCCRLQPLDLAHSGAYVERHLRRGGWNGDPALSDAGLVLLRRFSQGCPRYLNVAASRALAEAADRGARTLDAATVGAAVQALHEAGIGPQDREDADTTLPMLRCAAARQPWQWGLNAEERAFLGVAARGRQRRIPWSRGGLAPVARPYRLAVGIVAGLALVHTYGVLRQNAPSPEDAPRTTAVQAPPAAPTPRIRHERLLPDPAPTAAAPEADPIPDLLARAESALTQDRLTTPEADSAYRYFQQVLERAPQHAAARHGLRRIADRYRVLAEAALAQGAYERAHRLIERGRKVMPEDSALNDLRADVADLLAWSRQRVSVPTPPPVPAPPRPAAATPDTEPGPLQRLRTWFRERFGDARGAR